MIQVRVLACSLALAGLLSVAAAQSGGAPPLPVRLTLADGSTHDVLGPIEVREGKVLFRLPSGRLASLSVDEVSAMTPLPLPGVTPPVAGASREAPAAGDAGDLGRFTNDDLPPPLQGTRTIHRSTGEGPDAEPSELPIGYDDYRDKNGRGEAWWKARVEKLDRDLADAKKEMEEAYAALHALTREYRPVITDGRVQYAIREARERFEAAEGRWREVSLERSSLADEARRAGALPGWLR